MISNVEITLRQATADDADALAALAGELGYPTAAAVMRLRLADLQKSLVFANAAHEFASLRGVPRFRALIAKMNLQ